MSAMPSLKDGLAVLQAGEFPYTRAGDFPAGYPGYIMASILVINIFFTGLQLLWTKVGRCTSKPAETRVECA
jgi:hypothetical protein